MTNLHGFPRSQRTSTASPSGRRSIRPLPPASGRANVTAVSDKRKKGDQPKAAQRKDQSVHIFRISH